MKFKVEGVNTFPGRFIESEARRADSGDGPLALICVGEAAAEAADPEKADCVVAVGMADLGADRLREACNRAGKPLALLRCAPTIGTGMTGRWRDMVNAIYRGIYLRVDGNKARASMVHALDVGRAAVMSAGMNGAWGVRDGGDHPGQRRTRPSCRRCRGRSGKAHQRQARRAHEPEKGPSHGPATRYCHSRGSPCARTPLRRHLRQPCRRLSAARRHRARATRHPGIYIDPRLFR